MPTLALVVMLFLAGCTSRCDKATDGQQDKYMYKIDNPALIEMLTEFNNEFKDHEATQGRGLYVDCRGIYGDSIVYTIGYAGGIYCLPVVFCEPIDGKPVMLTMGGLMNEFSMDIHNYVELMRDINPEEYHYTKEVLDEWDKKPLSDGETIVWTPIAIYDFISLELTFDKSHNLLRVDTLGFAY